MSSPKCFISYSHETREHNDWVRHLATKLKENNVSVCLDQWDLKYGDDLPKYMETSIRESNFVLLICTPLFAEKANIGKGGVGYEKGIVTGEIYQNIHSPGKFVPILKSGNDDESLPSYLKGKLYADFRDDASFEEVFKDLLKHLYDEPKYVNHGLNKASTSSSGIVDLNISKNYNFIKLYQFAMKREPEGLGFISTQNAITFAEKYTELYDKSQIDLFINMCHFAMKREPEGLGFISTQNAITFAEKYTELYDKSQIDLFINMYHFAMKPVPEGLGFISTQNAITFAEKYTELYDKSQIDLFINMCHFAMKPVPEGLGFISTQNAITFAEKQIN